MTVRKVHWGILSTAHINRRLIPVIQASGQSVLHAVASRDEEKARSYATEWSIPVSYGSYGALLADPAIDAVYISLPNHLHTEWSVAAMEAGKQVLCEKPLCLSLNEHARLVATVERTYRNVTEAFMYLHHPQTDFFKQLVNSGKYGSLRAMRSAFCFKFGRDPDNYRVAETHGGGCLWDVGVYPISLFQYLAGSTPLGVNGRWRRRDGIDMRFWGTMEYPGDVTGEFLSSFEDDFTTETSIEFEHARLDISHPYINPAACVATVHTDAGSEQLTLPQAELYAGEVENVNALVLRGTAPLVTLDRSRWHLETVLALRASAQEGKPVLL